VDRKTVRRNRRPTGAGAGRRGGTGTLADWRASNMKHVATLARRELNVYFFSPIAYIVIAIFLALSGVFFVKWTFVPGNEASLRAVMGDAMPIILLIILPMISMRLLAEELRSGTIETLMTAPVSEVDVVLGKFCGAMAFYGVMLATTLLYAVVVAIWGTLDVGMLVCTYIGLVLLGGFFVSVGLFFSAWTRNQVIAVVCSVVVLLVLTFLVNLLALGLSGWPRIILQQINVFNHYPDFARGALVLNHVVFFVTMTGLFLFLTVKTLESRRWR
jgi:ABC-2 type transport system permease protein